MAFSKTLVVVVSIIITVIVIISIVFMIAGNQSKNVIREKMSQICDIEMVDATFSERARPTDIVVHHPRLYKNLLRGGDLGFMEGYIYQDWDCQDLDGVLTRLMQNYDSLMNIQNYGWRDIAGVIKHRCGNHQKIEEAKTNVLKHYDIGNDLYMRMLDPHMQYSCGYFERARDDDLDQAQLDKMELIARKLNLSEGMTVLDIGCGWGGLSNYLSKTRRVKVLGVSLSKEQIQFARDRYQDNPLVEYREIDYRHVPDDHTYHRIVSVGMIEHVGPKNYEEYFQKIKKLLAPDGIALIHGIGSYDKDRETSPFINKYIFPGGYIPRFQQLSQVIPKYFVVQDWHNFGKHYAKTLDCWYRNINRVWHEIPHYNETFRRMWNLYLVSCAAAFRFCHLHLWQIVITKNCRDIPQRACLP